MIQQQGQPEEVQKQDKKDDGRNASSHREEGRKGQSKRRDSSNESYSNQSSSFENKIGKRYYPHSEFKIHFYVRHVHMNGMSTNEFLSFIKRKGNVWQYLVNLAGSCDIVQIFNTQGSYCDVAIGMSNDDNAKISIHWQEALQFRKEWYDEINL
ncbi:unnamed protein product (macronuclear) [Paramecium tetraurelia]|uniref:Uncharacterized protein n=1 Tax=Paramecium tetraurelia TaxID=5888 RepID=A0CFL5_PARTE|nr:uncharacterized protein GSPATT00038022001 [Paramecium tetraurelia]CAK69582.1 unnamed protein product [Paramecium tetraurelia]|eukprot:XP_001436979.1 hypothetical protein (macronuclear) [Paramecium tetraurelia strain d4-2]